MDGYATHTLDRDILEQVRGGYRPIGIVLDFSRNPELASACSNAWANSQTQTFSRTLVGNQRYPAVVKFPGMWVVASGFLGAGIGLAAG